MIQLSKYFWANSGRMLRNNAAVVVSRPSLPSAYSTVNQTEEQQAEKKEEAAATAGELDELYKRIVVQVRGHDPAVLESYEKFVCLTGNHLECPASVKQLGSKQRRFIERWTLLKSRFGNRKHLRQYEMRTYFKEFSFQHLTGSTADTLLEYIQRNLPEGVAMHVHKTRLGPLPDHIKNNS